MKWAVLSMDIEDWYHLDYFDRKACDVSYSMIDGLDVYHLLLKRFAVPSSFFVLGELAARLQPKLQVLAKEGNDISSHGWSHLRPLTMPIKDCVEDFRRSKETVESAINRKVLGYRAPCFSFDRERLDALRAAGYSYDSSRINFGAHPLYGTLNMNGFKTVAPSVYRQDDFIEFEVSTIKLMGRSFPVSGGGYLRIFPWFLMRYWISRYLRDASLYVIYIHPFELSTRRLPPIPRSTSSLTRFRFSYGRRGTLGKLESLIGLLRQSGFEFTTFAKLHNQLLKNA